MDKREIRFSIGKQITNTNNTINENRDILPINFATSSKSITFVAEP